MQLVLYPRLAEPDRIRIWLGAFQCDGIFTPSWRIDGQPVTPDVVQALAAVRPGATGPRAFYGIYDFPVSARPQVRISVADPQGGPPVVIATRPSPPKLVDGGPPLRILLLSCFYVHQAEHRGLGKALERLMAIAGTAGIDMTVMLGDQVYLDLPTFEQYAHGQAWLAERFERKYVDNWCATSELAPILGCAPFVGVPDDHEYWNNAPEPQPWMDNLWTAPGRAAWHDAARQMFAAFQAHTPATPADPVTVDLGAVRLFLMDTRTDRKANAASCTTAPAISALTAWAKGGPASKCDVFVTGQSLFRTKAGGILGRYTDWELPNYQDFPSILGALHSSPRPKLFVTGDVHWGRVARYVHPARRYEVAEVIVSPAALVTTPIVDQAKVAWGWITSIFRDDPWPRHSSGDPPPLEFPTVTIPALPRYALVDDWSLIAGDQLALLEFTLRAGVLSIQTHYAPVTQRPLPAPRIPPIIFKGPSA